MEQKRLAYFYQDEMMRKDFEAFQLAVLDEMVLEDCYNSGGENAKSLQQTKKLITQSYRRLAEIFGKPESAKIDNPK